MNTLSATLFEQASHVIPGGVNSPVRAFKSVGGTPPFIAKAEGAYLFDVDNNRYIDYVGSWGPMIAGHAHPEVIKAVTEAATQGLSFGAPTAIEVTLAQRICDMMPSMDMVRMVNSGTEATMSAIRLARGFTGRDTFVKFEGGYHGHADSLLVKAGSGALTFGEPSSPGVPADVVKHTLTLDYNNSEQVREVFAKRGHEIACIIVEPVAGNMNCVPPVPGFLQTLRDVCDEYGSVLIFDEVMTGFRVNLNSAQGLYGIKPDLTTLGKIIGGGMPVGAYGGRRDIMACISPSGNIYQAGTLSGNPIAMAAGLATLDIISRDGFYEALVAKTTHYLEGVKALAQKHNVGIAINQVGAMFGLFFTDQAKVENFAQVMQCDVERFNRFFHVLLENGIYIAPSAFEAGFVSSAHSEADIEETLQVIDKAFAV